MTIALFFRCPMGLAKAGVQIRLTAIARNMKRSVKIIAAAGSPGKCTGFSRL